MTTDTNHKFRAHASVTTSQDFHGIQDNWRKTTCLTHVGRQNIETTSEKKTECTARSFEFE